MGGFFKTSDKPKRTAQAITLDTILAELESARVIAMTKGNAGAMVSATMAKAKLCGLDKGERLEVNHQPPIFNIHFVEPEIKIPQTLVQAI